MKKNIFAAMFAAFVLSTSLPSVTYATSLGLDTEPPIIESSFALVDYFVFGPDGDLSSFGAEVNFVIGVSPDGFTEISFGFGFDLANPTVGAVGGFDVVDTNGLFLGGDLVAVGFIEDVIELQFENLIGDAVGSFGPSVLAVIAFDDPLGSNPFLALVDGQSYVASLSFSNIKAINAVPGPATLPLLMLAFTAFGWINKGLNMRGA